LARSSPTPWLPLPTGARTDRPLLPRPAGVGVQRAGGALRLSAAVAGSEAGVRARVTHLICMKINYYLFK
jgi:hypothetical protein